VNELILASGSPRRVELMSRLGLHFNVQVSGVGEEVEDESDPAAMVIHLAERKARVVADPLHSGIVIGADTTVVIDGLVLNKPLDDGDARRMLRLLRGRVHSVWTGVVVIDAARDVTSSGAIRSLVTMCAYTDAEIDKYVATGEPLDKAGGYAIQGGSGIFVARIDGCYFNVVGLPMCELTRQLTTHGLHPVNQLEPCQLVDGSPCPLVYQDGYLARGR